MASTDQIKQKVLKAKKTMPTSCRKQLEILNKSKNVEGLKATVGRDIPNGHNQKKRTFSTNKENVKRMKTSEQINGNACVALERQTALLEQVKYWIQQEIYRINYKLFDKKMNELSERILKAQCRNKHEAIAGELIVKIGKLQRRIKTVLSSQENCLESNTVPSSTVCKTANPETIQNLAMNQESVNGPNERVTSVNCEPFNSSEKAREKSNLPLACAKLVSKSNTDDAMSMKNPNSTSPITSTPTENPALTLKSPSKAVSSKKEVTPITEAFDSFEHLPPLPEPPLPFPPLADKIRDTLPPQKPELRVKRVLRPLGIALTWNIPKVNPKCAPVESYHLFLCCEDSDHLTWKKIGEIKALPLPMACTLSHFLSSNKYYFTVQSKDIFGRYGPFCDIKSIPGFSENLT